MCTPCGSPPGKWFLVGYSSPTLHTTRRTSLRASPLVHAKMSARSMKTRRAPSRHCRDARIDDPRNYGHALYDDYPPTPPPPPPSHSLCCPRSEGSLAPRYAHSRRRRRRGTFKGKSEGIRGLSPLRSRDGMFRGGYTASGRLEGEGMTPLLVYVSKYSNTLWVTGLHIRSTAAKQSYLLLEVYMSSGHSPGVMDASPYCAIVATLYDSIQGYQGALQQKKLS